MPRHHGFPEARGRPLGATPRVAEKYERAEHSQVVDAPGGTFEDLHTFSGRPDAIDLVVAVRAPATDVFGSAIFQLLDRADREITQVEVVAHTQIRLHVGADRVRVRGPNTTSIRVSCVGYWAERGE